MPDSRNSSGRRHGTSVDKQFLRGFHQFPWGLVHRRIEWCLRFRQQQRRCNAGRSARSIQAKPVLPGGVQVAVVERDQATNQEPPV